MSSLNEDKIWTKDRYETINSVAIIVLAFFLRIFVQIIRVPLYLAR